MKVPRLDVANRNIQLDILRALAIILIVLGHLTGFLDPGILTKALSVIEVPILYLGLAIFFLISGFALYLNNKSFENSQQVFRFYKKRFVRIYPLYWIAVAAIIVEYQVLHFTTASMNLSISEMLATFLGAQALLASRFVSEPIVLWFVGLILIFYLLYPLMIYAITSHKAVFFKLLLIFVAFLSVHALFNIVDSRFFIYYWIFIAGIFFCKYYSYVKPSVNVNKRLILFGGAVLIILALLFQAEFFATVYGKDLLLNTASHLPADFWTNSAGLIGVLLVIPLFLAVHLINTQDRTNLLYLAYLLAYSSFCVYLFHGVILEDLRYFGLAMIHLSGPWLNLFLVAVGLPVVFFTGFLIQSGTMPQLRARRNIRTHNRVSTV